ncbi:recombinase family protein, partial [Enterococcus faecalis]|uniref:recombinase family protein n=1 Tax=Enterococcus faecalis TaxID=1351 RepID=UPI003CC5DD20
MDDGISGVTTTHRPEFLRMISDVENGLVDSIICKSLARAFRNTGDQNRHMREVFPHFQPRIITLD